jgi:ABC-2 type transport system ATP-binding protein
MLEHTPTLVRNLIAERREAVEELLVFVQSFAPDLFPEARIAAGELRANGPTREKFAFLRNLYQRALGDFRKTVEHTVVEGRFEQALTDCDSLASGLAPQLRQEILLQRGRCRDLLRDERQGHLEATSAAKNKLRADIFETLQVLMDAVALSAFETRVGALNAAMQDERASSLPTDSLETRVIIGADPEVVIECKDVAKRYSSLGDYALRGVTLQVRVGRILGVLGLNGSGKSTLLRILAGDLVHDAGTVERHGVSRGDVAFVPQRIEPWSGSLEQHLYQHAAYHGHTGVKNQRYVDETLALLDLERYADARFGELSAGIQTRCALAEALVASPKLLILDEPLAALDPIAQYRFLADLHSHARYALRRLPVVVSSQHIKAIESFADEILLLRDGKQVLLSEPAMIGSGRASNVFELHCPAPERKLRQALSRLSPIQILPRPDGLSSSVDGIYEVRLPRAVSKEMLIEALRESGIFPDYFADLSRSSIARLMDHD